MVQRTGSGGAAREVVFIKNNYFHDAFFLKALGQSPFWHNTGAVLICVIVLNGACSVWCEPEKGDERYRVSLSTRCGVLLTHIITL